MVKVEADIVISARVAATESAEKITAAIAKFFPDAKCASEGECVRCRSTDASALRDAIFGRRILDAVRSILRSNVRGNKTTIELNRQAAAVGKVSVDAGGSALGPIIVEVQSPDMEGFIDWLTPRTEKGRPIITESHVD